MIISRARNFVFVKTTKTAGTSIEIALSEFCGPEDLITPLVENDEAIRRAKGFRGAQNNIVTAPDGERLEFYAHAPARRARRLMGQAAWKSAFRFAFERNPFDRVVSAYHYTRKNRQAQGKWDADPMTFSQFLRRPKLMDGLHKRGWGLYTDGQDRIIVDQVYRFEDLAGAMADIHARLDLPPPAPLEKTKISDRAPGYRDAYDAEGRAIVEQVFARELEAFGYTF